MNRAYIFYGWKIDARYAFELFESLDEDEMYNWFSTELAPNIFLSHNCPAPGLLLHECDFYITLGPTRLIPHDPDEFYELLRDRELLEEGWRICKNLCCLPRDVRMTQPEITAVTHFF